MTHALSKLGFSKEDFPNRFLLKQFGFLFIMSADNYFDPGVEGARSLDHLPRIESVGRGNYEHPSASDMGLNQHGRICGIPRDRCNTAFSQFFDKLTVLLDHDIGNALLGEIFADAAANAAISLYDSPPATLILTRNK